MVGEFAGRGKAPRAPLGPEGATRIQREEPYRVELIAGVETLLPGEAFDSFEGMPGHFKQLPAIEPFDGAIHHGGVDAVEGPLVTVVPHFSEGRHGNAQLLLELSAHRVFRRFAVLNVPPGESPVRALKVPYARVHNHQKVIAGAKNATRGAQAGRGAAGKQSTHESARWLKKSPLYAVKMTLSLTPRC